VIPLVWLPGSRQLSERNWPAVGLDVVSLRGEGWTEYPFRQFVLKVNGRCNLSCTYCYVYELADQSWRDKPRIISSSTLRQVAFRIAEHAAEHRLPAVEIIFHGGEPLLCGESFIRSAVVRLRDALAAETELSLRLQTNGTLLTERMLAMLHEQDIKVGVSVDGTAQTHDARRRYPHGGGSYSLVSAALRRLAEERYSAIYSGVLCTIDIYADPIETYESLAALAPPRVDFLLPHANWSVLPPAAPAVRYGEWLSAVFDRWYGQHAPETRVRLFEEIINLLLGGHSSSEAIGLSPVGLIVIDTNGSIEQVDTLKSAFPGAPDTGMNVFKHSFDDVLGHPAIMARQIGDKALSDTCLACPVGKICGGGYYPHRYSQGEGFRNPSVYCEGLRYLIEHIARRIRADLREPSAC
jgi:uncharacterized protein